MRRLFRLWRLGRDDLRVLLYALRHPLRPGWLLPLSALLAVYALEPANFAIPLLGFVDDLVLLPLILHQLVKRLPASLRSDYQRGVSGSRGGAFFT